MSNAHRRKRADKRAGEDDASEPAAQRTKPDEASSGASAASAAAAAAAAAASEASGDEPVTLTFRIVCLNLKHPLHLSLSHPPATAFGTVLEALDKALRTHDETCPKCNVTVRMPRGPPMRCSTFHYNGMNARSGHVILPIRRVLRLGTPFVQVSAKAPAAQGAAEAASQPASTETIYAGIDVPLSTPLSQLSTRQWTCTVTSILVNTMRYLHRARLDVMLDLWRQGHELHTLAETRCPLTLCEPGEAEPRRHTGDARYSNDEKKVQQVGDGVWSKLILLGAPIGSEAAETAGTSWRLVNACALVIAVRANGNRCVVTNRVLARPCVTTLAVTAAGRLAVSDDDATPLSIPKVLCWYE